MDLNAGMKGEGFMLNTFAHELTHFIFEQSPAKAKKLANFLVEQYGKSGQSVEELVRARMKKSGLSYAEAFEEVVADSMERMFVDGDVMSKLLELKKQDSGLFNMIKQFIDKWVSKLRKYYGKDGIYVTTIGKQASELEQFEKLQQLFAEALVDAGENYQKAQKNTTQEGGEISEAALKRSDRIVDQIRNSLSDIMALDSVYTIDASNATTYTGVHKLDENYGRDVFDAQGKAAIRPGFGRVVLGRGGVVNTVFHGNGPAKQAAFPAIKAVIENGVEIGQDVNHRGRGYDTVTFGAPVDFFGTKAPLGVVVQIFNNGRGDKSFYIHEICDSEGNYIELVDGVPRKKVSSTGEVDSSSTAGTADKGISPNNSIRNPDGIVNTETEKTEEKKSERDEEFDYSGLNWATELGIITAKDRAIFERTINNEIYRGAKPQSATGEYIIDTGKCLLFTDGDFHNPTLSRVIEFATEYESLTDYAKRRIIDEAKVAGDIQESISAIESIFGEGFVRGYTKPDGQTYAGQKRGGKGSSRSGTHQKARSLREILAAEGKEYLLDDDADEQESYSERDDSSISNRSLLANALESLASDDKERSKIAEYKASLGAMEAEEAKLRELNAQIKELSFAKGKRDMEKIRKLRDEARKTTNRINIYEKQLLRLEAAKPLQKVLERERKRAYDRAKQKNKEAMAEYKKSVDEKFDAITQQYREQRKEAVAKVRETSAKKDVRQKILSFKKRMEQRLLRPTDTQYVPAGLAKAMVEVCELITFRRRACALRLNHL